MGNETHTIVDNILGENEPEAWTTLVKRFDLASAYANLNVMSKSLKSSPNAKSRRHSFLIKTWKTWCDVRTSEPAERRALMVLRAPS